VDPIGWYVIGGVLFLVGVVLLLMNIRNMQRRSRIIATPTSKIAQASGVGPVEINGAIIPDEQGVFTTPIGQKPAVWARVVVQEYRRRGRSSQYVTIYKETYDRIFYVDDGSGERARVVTQDAHMVLDQKQVASSGVLRDPPPHVQEFLAQRGIATTGLVFNRNLRFTEEVLGPGDMLYALGPSMREGGAPAGPFRQGPPGPLTLRAGAGFANELILTNKPETQLTSKLLLPTIIGAVLTGAGAICAVVGALS